MLGSIHKTLAHPIYVPYIRTTLSGYKFNSKAAADKIILLDRRWLEQIKSDDIDSICVLANKKQKTLVAATKMQDYQIIQGVYEHQLIISQREIFKIFQFFHSFKLLWAMEITKSKNIFKKTQLNKMNHYRTNIINSTRWYCAQTRYL